MINLELIKVKKIISINTEGGSVNKIFSTLDSQFHGFGEIYTSSVDPGYVKAWKYHKKMIINLIVIDGDIKFVFYNGTKFKEINVSSKDMLKITVPSRIWYGFKGLSKHPSLILSISNIVFDEDEIERKNINDINYNW